MITGLCCLGLHGQPIHQLLSNKPLIQTNQDGTLQIGSVKLDPTGKSIMFPAEINMREGQLEYALTGPFGKLHEALLQTDASPVNIHLAMLLMGIEGSAQLPDASKSEKRRQIQIIVEWEKDNTPIRKPLEELILNQETNQPIESKHWRYTGAQIIEGTFTVHREQSYIAIIEDSDALVNSNAPNRKNDDIWSANSVILPEIGTKVTVSFRLQQNNESRSKVQESTQK